MTGAAGYVGRHLRPLLPSELHVTATDLSASEAAGIVALDVTRPSEVADLAAGHDAIIHLAIAGGFEGTYESDSLNAERFRVNVWGTRNVFEAAALVGVPRVVFTSSIMVVWGYGDGELVPRDAPPRPVGCYALTKLLGEEIAREFARSRGVSSAILRIAKPIDPRDPRRSGRPIRPQWIAFAELADVYARACRVPLDGSQVFHVVGESSRRRWELEAARDILGYLPRTRLEDLGFTLDEGAALD